MLRLLWANITLNRSFQTFLVTKILTQRFMQNQLLALPLPDLPPILMSIPSISLSFPRRLIPTIPHMDFTWSEQPTGSRLLFLGILAFFPSFHGPLSKCNQTQSAATATGRLPPFHPPAMGEDKVIYYILYFLCNHKWDATLEACLVEIRHVAGALYAYQESAGLYKDYICTYLCIYTHAYSYPHPQ